MKPDSAAPGGPTQVRRSARHASMRATTTSTRGRAARAVQGLPASRRAWQDGDRGYQRRPRCKWCCRTWNAARRIRIRSESACCRIRSVRNEVLAQGASGAEACAARRPRCQHRRRAGRGVHVQLGVRHHGLQAPKRRTPTCSCGSADTTAKAAGWMHWW
jgi:hypothetical protein